MRTNLEIKNRRFLMIKSVRRKFLMLTSNNSFRTKSVMKMIVKKITLLSLRYSTWFYLRYQFKV